MSIWVEMLLNARFVHQVVPDQTAPHLGPFVADAFRNVSSSRKVNIYRQFQSSRFNFSNKPYVVGTQKNRVSESSFRAPKIYRS